MVLPRTRAKLTVEWDLDPVPGWNDNPRDLVTNLQHHLNSAMPHYNPKVTFVSTDDDDYVPLTRIVDHGDGELSWFNEPEDED